jgi:branched-subunit amino acid aminotransferase/4-amino-4-deoxychorismate lyase
MSSVIADVFRWGEQGLQLLDYCDVTDSTIVAADSWLVSNGKSLALGLHRQRFMTSIPRGYYARSDPEAFWDAAIAAIPREGEWFPRVEVHTGPRFLFRLRTAPELKKSIALTTHHGADPRTTPQVKGPDLEAMTRLRTTAQAQGADEAVILTDDGYLVESSQSALVWWRGNILCSPPPEFARVDSVTARSLLGLAGALGVELHTEAVTPAELSGVEVWALNALHGPRIVTTWIDGPALAELPGRLTLWREKLAALRHELPNSNG